MANANPSGPGKETPKQKPRNTGRKVRKGLIQLKNEDGTPRKVGPPRDRFVKGEKAKAEHKPAAEES